VADFGQFDRLRKFKLSSPAANHYKLQEKNSGEIGQIALFSIMRPCNLADFTTSRLLFHLLECYRKDAASWQQSPQFFSVHTFFVRES
jgi:hypothetical protein